MSKPNEQYAYFTVVGDFEPDSISKALSIRPTDSWRKGDIHLGSGRERKFSRWSLRSRLPNTDDLEQHIIDVLEQLQGCESAVCEVSAQHYSCMQLVGYFHEIYSGLSLNAETVMNLAKFNLHLDCDFYYLWSDSREDT